jgi:hypothetical protein
MATTTGERHKALFAHQPGHALSAYAFPVSLEIFVHARTPVATLARVMNRD